MERPGFFNPGLFPRAGLSIARAFFVFREGAIYFWRAEPSRPARRPREPLSGKYQQAENRKAAAKAAAALSIKLESI